MANMSTNASMLSLTPAQLAALPPNEQAAYMKGMSPSQQALVAQEIQQARISTNRQYMRSSVEKVAYMPVTGGSGTSATLTAWPRTAADAYARRCAAFLCRMTTNF